jgi:outer membrane murein-binding lipoprotein Lpp
MKKALEKGLVFAVAVTALVIAGCQEQQLPDEKRTRTIAAENIKLKKDLEQRDSQIVTLSRLHDEQSRQKDKQLAECRESQKALREQLQKQTREQVEEVLQAVMERNVEITKENESLKAEVEKLKAELEKAKTP